MSATIAQEQPKLKGWRLLKAAFSNRKMGIMLALGVSAGLPNALLIGTLFAWLGAEKVDLGTMGVLSLIGLAYSFKFLWSPLIDKVRLPLLERLGRRKSWLLPIQILLGLIFIVMSAVSPVSALGLFSFMAGIGAIASATQDIVIDGWRVEVADEVAPLEIMSSIYQLGYRLATLLGGALALVLAERIGWPNVFLLAGSLMFVLAGLTLFAPDTKRPDLDEGKFYKIIGNVAPKFRLIAIAIVGAAWIWALGTIINFMIQSLGAEPSARPDAKEFTKTYAPIIVLATVILPAIMAAWINNKVVPTDAPLETKHTAPYRLADQAYSALLMPLAEIIGRLRWGAVIALGVILTYRLTDSVWGPFAFPFYLEELKYSNDEVAFASKFFGVGMTMLGISIGAISFATIGRMATLLIGAILASASNLLYADLAMGGVGIDNFGGFTGVYWLFEQFGSDARYSRLLLAISGENLASGIAGAAFVAYLSSITSKEYSIVQYALLSSLTSLVGSLGRGALGETIKSDGYAYIFFLTAALGVIAIILCLFEWLRSKREVTVQ
jgi:MFS transporter, PAT family, beta-lactamase induction signal transducer AmpG